jgi:hypothetical protein
MTDAKRDLSPLVKAAIALDEYFAELERLGGKLNSLEMKSEFDFEHAEKLMARFAECGQGVSDEVTNLAAHLNEARAKAEVIAGTVAKRAEMVRARKADQHSKFEEYRLIGEGVRELSVALADLKRPEGEKISDEDRAHINLRLSQFEDQLNPLIDRAQTLRKDAQVAKIKLLEQNADSLAQTLQAIRQRLNSLNLPQHLN